MAHTIGSTAPDFEAETSEGTISFQDIEAIQGTAPNYPLIGDSDFNVSKLYGMLPADVEGDPTARTPADNRPYIRIVPQPNGA